MMNPTDWIITPSVIMKYVAAAPELPTLCHANEQMGATMVYFLAGRTGLNAQL